MLESSGLLLRSWTAPPPARWFRHIRPEAGSQTRAILDLATAAALGFAYRRPGTAGRWLRWLGQPRIEFYETEDASLVCTAGRRWWSERWDVADAEGRAVGVCRPGVFDLSAATVQLWQLHAAAGVDRPKYRGILVQDRFGRGLAWGDPAGPATGRFIATDGVVLALLTHSTQGTEVRFASAGDGNPFLKMLLLAALLAGGW